MAPGKIFPKMRAWLYRRFAWVTKDDNKTQGVFFVLDEFWQVHPLGSKLMTALEGKCLKFSLWERLCKNALGTVAGKAWTFSVVGVVAGMGGVLMLSLAPWNEKAYVGAVISFLLIMLTVSSLAGLTLGDGWRKVFPRTGMAVDLMRAIERERTDELGYIFTYASGARRERLAAVDIQGALLSSHHREVRTWALRNLSSGEGVRTGNSTQDHRSTHSSEFAHYREHGEAPFRTQSFAGGL